MEASSGVPIAKIRLIFRGKSLDDAQILGSQCQIEHENVVHMVEKTVPTDAPVARAADGTSGQTLSPSANSPGSNAVPMHGAPGAPGAHPGPNLVIRTVQFGWDPATAQQAGTVNPSANPSVAPSDGTQPLQAPQAANPPAQQGAAPQLDVNFFQNIMTNAMQAASALFAPQGAASASSSEASTPSTASGASSPTPSGASASPAPGASGMPTGHHPLPNGAPQGIPRGNIREIRINVPSPMPYLTGLIGGVEVEIMDQLEQMIITLGRDIVDFGPEAANMIPRSYEVRPVPAAAAIVNTPNAEGITVAALWKRFNQLQSRWLDILRAVEGNTPLFTPQNPPLEAGNGPANVSMSDLPPPRLMSNETTASGNPLLDLPLRHPLRHVVEHLAPHVGAQFANMNQHFFPLLSHHHNSHYHRLPAGMTPASVAATTLQQNANPSAPSSSHPNANSNASMETSSHTSLDTLQSRTDPSISQSSSSDFSDDSDVDSMVLGSNPNRDELLRREVEALQERTGLLLDETADDPLRGMAGGMDDFDELDDAADELMRSLSLENTASSVAPSSLDSSKPTNDQLWASWQETIKRDVEAQTRINSNQPQQPFSDAYRETPRRSRTNASSSLTPTHSLLQRLMVDVEQRIPGSSANDLPLSSAPMPPALLQSFETRLERFIQSRLAEDPDWKEMKARGNTEKFPNLRDM